MWRCGKLIGHYYEREKGAPLIVFFHGLWGHSYLDGVPIYRITQKHNWNLLLCDLRAQGDSEGEFSTLGVLEKYDCLDWVEWAQNRFGDKNPIFLMGVSMGASIVMMSSDLEFHDIDDLVPNAAESEPVAKSFVKCHGWLGHLGDRERRAETDYRVHRECDHDGAV